jgi:hypothetical protein
LPKDSLLRRKKAITVELVFYYNAWPDFKGKCREVLALRSFLPPSERSNDNQSQDLTKIKQAMIIIKFLLHYTSNVIKVLL